MPRVIGSASGFGSAVRVFSRHHKPPGSGGGGVGAITVQLPAGSTVINAQITTQDVYSGVFSALPTADGVAPQTRLNTLAPPNMRFHAGTDSVPAAACVLPFPPPPLGSALPYSDAFKTISTAWDFTNLNSLLQDAASFGGSGGSPLLLNPRYLPDNMWTGTGWGTAGTFSDLTFANAGQYFADLISYYNTSGASPPVTGMTPWPKPAGPWPIKYLEVYNEPDFSSENPRNPPAVLAPTLTLSKVAGGSLAAGTYGYVAAGLCNTGVPGNGEGVAGTEANITLTSADITAGNRSIKLTWSATSNLGLPPSAYTIYGRTVGAELLMCVVGSLASGGLTFTDTGAITPAGNSPPTSDSSAGGNLLSALDYRSLWDQVVSHVTAVDSTIKFVGPVATNPISISGGSVIRTVGPTSGPADTSYYDTRDYVQVITDVVETHPPDVISYHGYGGSLGSTDSDATMMSRIDGIVADLTSNVLPYSGTTPLWHTEANVNAGGFSATDARGVNNYAVAWWGKLFTLLAKLSPHVQNLYQFLLSNSNTFDVIFDATYSGIAQSLAGRPVLPYWAFLYINQLFPPGSKVMTVTGTPAGTHVLACQKPSSTAVSVLLTNDAVPAVTLSTSVGLAGGSSSATTMRVIDSTTNYATGPSLQTLGAVNSVSVTINGYGIALITFQP